MPALSKRSFVSRSFLWHILVFFAVKAVGLVLEQNSSDGLLVLFVNCLKVSLVFKELKHRLLELRKTKQVLYAHGFIFENLRNDRSSF